MRGVWLLGLCGADALGAARRARGGGAAPRRPARRRSARTDVERAPADGLAEDAAGGATLPALAVAAAAAAAAPAVTFDTATATAARPALTFDGVKRRLWTKLDFGHTHAISGAAFLVFGLAWLAAAACGEVAAPMPAPGAPIWGAGASLAILGVGVWNGLSALPMAGDDRVANRDLDHYHALAFRWGGTAQLVACAWLCWWFSGLYPAFDAPAVRATAAAVDDALCVAAAASIAWVIYFSEESISSLHRKRRAGGYVHGRLATDLAPGEVVQLVALARLGSYPNLFQLPVLANVLLGGRPWLAAIGEAYPAQPPLLHHYLFACALSYAVTFFATTLRDRGLVSIRQDLAMLTAGTALPFCTMFVDTALYPAATTLNPLDYNVGCIPF